jgi:hypothetical protein
MKTINIAQAKERIGEVIPGVTGIIQKIFPRKTGTSEHGEWSLQNGEMSDDTGIIKFTLSGAKEPMPESWKGKTVTMMSCQTKHGLQGVKVEQKEYNGTTHVGLKLTATANIIEGTPKEVFESPAPTKTGNTTPTIQVKPQPSVAQNQANPEERIKRYAKLYYMCMEEAEKLLEPGDVENMRSISSCLFIQGVKEGLLERITVENTEVAPF